MNLSQLDVYEYPHATYPNYETTRLTIMIITYILDRANQNVFKCNLVKGKGRNDDLKSLGWFHLIWWWCE